MVPKSRLIEKPSSNKPLCSSGRVCTEAYCFDLEAQDTNKTKAEEAVKHL